MAHFRGRIQGIRGEASRLGSPKSGLQVEAASWQGKVTVSLSVNDAGQDVALVELDLHHGKGTRKTLYDGPVNGDRAARA